MGKKRAGGGAKAFMRSVMHRNEDKDDETDAADDTAQTAIAPVDATTDAVVSPPADDVPTAQDTTRPDVEAKPANDEAPKQETRGQMLQRHKKELKAVKDAVKKLGKKRKDEGEKLEADTAQRQAAELAALDAGTATVAPADGSDAGADALVAKSLYGLSVSDDQPAKKESSRAQKRREKAAQQEAEREKRIAEEQAEMGDSDRKLEEEALVRLLQPKGLALRDIPPDGNCLYRAVEDQLSAVACNGERVPDHDSLRQAAAEYMRQHEKEFAPFVLPEVVEEANEEDAHEQFQRYCDAMAASAVWGGQAELNALSHVLQRTIEVYSVGMPAVSMGEEYSDKGPPLRVSFHRHAYELGEHFNSVVAAESEDQHNGGSFSEVDR